MLRKLALKRFTGSDLTLFEWQFKNINKGNQKSINLNANIFVEKLYPLLPDIADEKGGRIPIDLSIYGPGMHELDNLQRKIIKGGSYKNWRLNGEFIHNRLETPERYNVLVEGDFGLFEFYGIEYPSAAKLLLIAQNSIEDRDLHNKLEEFYEGKSMVVVESSELHSIVDAVNPIKEHPIYKFILENELEEIILTGGDVEQGLITSKPSFRSINVADFQKAKKTAEINGRRGEEFINEYFSKQISLGKINSFNWQSNINPISPFDFLIVNNKGEEIYLDVKSTSGPFDNVIHVSFNELLQMSNKDKYDLYRVYSIAENTAILKIASNLKEWAQKILDTLQKLPVGVKSAGISIKPELLEFGPEVKISIEDE